MEKYIRQCLDSLVNQTLKDIEIVCVNDGSKDSSGKILDEYAAKDNRFVIINQKNKGTGIARNNGIKAATGAYIMFCDPDDWYEIEACEKAYNFIKARGSDYSYFRLFLYNEETGERKEDFGGRFRWIDEVPDKDNIVFRKLDCLFIKPNECWFKIYNRKFLLENKIKFTKTKFFQDFPFAIRAMLASNSVSYLNEPLVNYRIRRFSATSVEGSFRWRAIFYNREVMLHDILKSPYREKFLPSYIQNCITSFYYWYNHFSKNPKFNRRAFYNKMRRYFKKLDRLYDVSKLEPYIRYKWYKKVLKDSYDAETIRKYQKDIKRASKKFIQNIFSLTNENREDCSHKIITIIGIKLKIRRSHA